MHAMRVFYGRTAIVMVAMQCVFCVFWQESDIKCSDAMRVFFWQDSDINCSDANRIFLWQDSDINCSEAMRVFYGGTVIPIVAMQCVFLWHDSDINGSYAVRVLCILAGQRHEW